jgi:hypothetical protein
VQKIAQQPGVTFAIDEVAPATTPLPEQRMHQAVKGLLGDIESCCDYHGTVIQGVHYQPLLAAVYTAFSQHRPLMLTPDAVWITIAQGVAQHMTLHGERLRPRFVVHQGRLDLVSVCSGWVEGSPENPWPEAFASWTGQIRDHVGPAVHDALVCDFSTTGAVERAASQIVMMDVFERYFHYLEYCICGIPAITLAGTPGDWQHLAEKAAGLAVFDLDWWLAHLLPICQQFVRASRGDVDLAHWQGICKLRHAYGGDVINGWVAMLFPYLRAFLGGPCNRRNPIFDTGAGFQTLVAPPGVSRVPFTWKNEQTGRQRHMEAIGGLVGVAQDPSTLALQPKVGWAVREANPMDVLLSRLAAEHTTFPGAKLGSAHPRGWPLGAGLSADLAQFYHATDGAALFGRGEAALCRIVPAGDIEPLDWGEVPDPNGGYSRGPGDRTWYRFAELADRTWLAINLDPHRRDPRPRGVGPGQYDWLFSPICRCSASTVGQPGQNPVVALSFTELLQRLLDGGGQPCWSDPQFVSYGDAEQYTRRDWSE